jgi:chromosome segregation ATPase
MRLGEAAGRRAADIGVRAAQKGGVPSISRAAALAGAGQEPQPLTEEDLDAQDPKELQYRVTILGEELANMEPDMSAIERYHAKDAEYGARVADLEAITSDRDQVRVSTSARRTDCETHR